MLTLVEKTIEQRTGAQTLPSDNGGGRPSDWRPEYAEAAFKFSLLGCSNQRIAELLGVSPATLDRWLIQHPELGEAIRNGRDRADAEIAEAMYRRAKGYDITVVRREVNRVRKPGPDGKGIIETHEKVIETSQHIPAETGIGEKWLRLRHPEWRLPPDERRPITVADLLALADAAEAAERRYIDAFAEHEPDTDGRAAEACEDG